MIFSVFLNKKKKYLVKKNHHTLHFFCYFDNIKILKNNENYSDGYKYKRNITNPLAKSFNINYDDQSLQYKWCKIFNADISFLKFKIPRFKNKYKYFDGKLFIQPFPPTTTNKSRLVVKKNPVDKIYDLNDYEDKFYYHNRILRVCNYSKLHNYKYKYFCNYYDCTLFFLILENYINKFNPDLSIYTLIKKIFKYLENYNNIIKKIV